VVLKKKEKKKEEAKLVGVKRRAGLELCYVQCSSVILLGRILVGHVLVTGSYVYLFYVVIWVGLDLSLLGVLLTTC